MSSPDASAKPTSGSASWVYPAQRAWSDRYLPAALEVLTGLLSGNVTLSSDHDDMRNACDAYGPEGQHISLRFRRPDMWRYRDELTVRTGVMSGRETELDKVRDGACDLFFVAVASESGDGFDHWFLADADRLRDELPRVDTTRVYGNTDGSTSFLAIDTLAHPSVRVASSSSVRHERPLRLIAMERFRALGGR